jgi:hypothetical protein
MPPIYPDETLGEKAGAEKMKDEAYALCKAKYEEVYGVPLTYEEPETAEENTENQENEATVSEMNEAEE